MRQVLADVAHTVYAGGLSNYMLLQLLENGFVYRGRVFVQHKSIAP